MNALLAARASIGSDSLADYIWIIADFQVHTWPTLKGIYSVIHETTPFG